jgi:hypothetical protein
MDSGLATGLKRQNKKSREGLGHYKANIVSMCSRYYILPGVVVTAFFFCWRKVGRSGVRIPWVDLFLCFDRT